METVKPEIVNEIEFIPTTNRHSEVVDPYTSDFRATISVKVGNIVKTLTLAQNSKYHSSEGRYGTPEYKESWDEQWSGLYHKAENPFQDVIDSGLIDINFSEVITKYDEKVAEAKKHKEQLKKEAEKARIAELKEKYKTCWALQLNKLLAEEKNKTLVEKRKEIKIVSCTEDSYLKHGGVATAEFWYKNLFTNVSIYDGKYEWTGAYEHIPGKEGIDYHRIADGKARRSKWVMTTLVKFVEAVDEFLKNREYQNKSQNEAYLKRRKEVKILEETCGFPITVIKKEKYSKDYGRSRSSRRWTEYTYMLVTKIADSEYGDYKGIKVNTTTETEYVNNIRTEIPNTRSFSIENINKKLSKEQFNIILGVLLENETVYKVTKKEDKTKKVETE